MRCTFSTALRVYIFISVYVILFFFLAVHVFVRLSYVPLHFCIYHSFLFSFCHSLSPFSIPPCLLLRRFATVSSCCWVSTVSNHVQLVVVLLLRSSLFHQLCSSLENTRCFVVFHFSHKFALRVFAFGSLRFFASLLP